MRMQLTRSRLESWIDLYERAWRSAGIDALESLFSADVGYWTSPWDEPVRGLAALGTLWDAERDGPDESFDITSEVVAVDGDTGVLRVELDYRNGTRWRDIWIVRFDRHGKCEHFEEWPIAPPNRHSTQLHGVAPESTA
jgi:SnoaL-like domain